MLFWEEFKLVGCIISFEFLIPFQLSDHIKPHSLAILEQTTFYVLDSKIAVNDQKGDQPHALGEFLHSNSLIENLSSFSCPLSKHSLINGFIALLPAFLCPVYCFEGIVEWN